MRVAYNEKLYLFIILIIINFFALAYRRLLWYILNIVKFLVGGVPMNSNKAILIKELIESIEAVSKCPAASKIKMTLKGENHFLCNLSHLGGVSTPGEIASSTVFTNARLSMIIKRLEIKGLIERQKDEKDKRCTIIRMTPRGEETVKKLEDEIVESVGFLVDGLGEDDSRQLLKLLKKFSDIEITR